MRGLAEGSATPRAFGAVYTSGGVHSLPRRPLRPCLRHRRVDAESGLPLGPAALALRYVLPVYDLEQNVPPDTSPLQRALSARAELSGALGWLVTGSSVERLAVPPFTQRAGGAAADAPFYTTADIDVMVEMRQLPVAVRRGAGHLYMDTSSAGHRGYARVVLDARPDESDHLQHVRQHFEVVAEGDAGVLYVSESRLGSEVIAKWREVAADIHVHRQGPAINMQQPDENGPGRCRMLHDMDIVPALPLTGALPELSVWLSRVSAEGVVWPPPDTREEIRRDGRCFLVKVGHPNSERRDLEWRISFSDPEKRLAACLTPNQRKVYLLIKLMQKCYLQEPKVLVTYHLKTMMFWELETCGIADWVEENLFEHMLSVLDRIIGCLERGFIPSYFIPDNNLISQASADHVASVLATLRQVRRQPLQHVYGIDERLRFDFSSWEPLAQLHQPLREAVLAGDVDRVADAVALSLIRQAQSDIRRGVAVAFRCVDLLHDAWEALSPEHGPHPVHDDWTMFAAAAVFSSMGLEESAWLIEVVQIALAQQSPSPLQRLSTDDVEVLTTLLPGLALGEVAGEKAQVMGDVVSSCSLQSASPAFSVLTLRHAQLELIRDVKNKLNENIASCPPILSAANTAQLQIGLIHLTLKHQLMLGVPRPFAVKEAIQKVVAMLQSMTSVSGDSQSATRALASIKGSVEHIISSTKDRATPIFGAEGDVAGQITSALDEVGVALQVEPTHPSCLAFVTDHNTIDVIPMTMMLTFIHSLAPGLGDELIDHQCTPFLNMIGFFVKHKLYGHACRMTVRMTCAKAMAPDVVLERIVYDLNRAPLYLETLPPPARALLGLTTGRAAVGAIYLFVDFVHLLLDPELMENFLDVPRDLARLERLASLAEVPPDVRLTHQMMRLCALHVLGRDCTGCFRDLDAAAGQSVALQAGLITHRWQAATAE